MTPTQALRELIQTAQLAARQKGRPFNNVLDLLGNPDYELFFADNIFLMDHERGKGYVVVNCIITDGDREVAIREAQSCFDYYFNIARFDAPEGDKFTGELPEAATDTTQPEYEEMVRQAKRHIIDGDIFQVVLSRTKMEPKPASRTPAMA